MAQSGLLHHGRALLFSHVHEWRTHRLKTGAAVTGSRSGLVTLIINPPSKVRLRLQHALCKHVYQTKDREQSACILLWRGSMTLTHRVYKPSRFCLTHSAGKLDFPSLGIGLPNRIISSPIYCHLIPEISVLAWRFPQTNKQTEKGGRGVQALNHLLPRWVIEWGTGGFLPFFSTFHFFWFIWRTILEQRVCN